MKKTVCIIWLLLLILSLPACGNTDVPKATTDAPVITVSPADNSSEQSSFPVSVPTDCVFNPAQFDGKLQSCAYAGDGKLLVTADKLYLYDTVTSSVLAVTGAPLRDFDVQIMEGSYMLSGMGDDGMIAYIYDHSLKQAYEIPVNELLMEDFVISETGIAASTDGKKLAIAAMRGLYLYDLESESLTTLLDLTQNVGIASVGISMIHGLAFTQDNSQLVFYGSGLSIPAVNDEDSFSVYGSIALDGSNLQLTKSFNYDIEEMQSRTDRLFFPQTFTQNNVEVTLLCRFRTRHNEEMVCPTDLCHQWCHKFIIFVCFIKLPHPIEAAPVKPFKVWAALGDICSDFINYLIAKTEISTQT